MFFFFSLSAVTERQPATHLGHDNKHNGRDDAATQQHQFDVFRPVRPSNLLRLPLKVDRLPAARAHTHISGEGLTASSAAGWRTSGRQSSRLTSPGAPRAPKLSLEDTAAGVNGLHVQARVGGGRDGERGAPIVLCITPFVFSISSWISLDCRDRASLLEK